MGKMLPSLSVAAWLAAMLAFDAAAVAGDCSQSSTQADYDAYRAQQPPTTNMCDAARLEIKLMHKALEILDRCPGNDPTGDNRWQAQQSIKAAQNTLDTQCSD